MKELILINFESGCSMNVEFATIASSSNGNSVYIGTKYTKILIDAGLSGKKIQEGLKKLNLTGNDIDAIFVTHEHIDHVDGIGVLSRRFNIPIYATEGTWGYMPSKVGNINADNRNFIYSEENFILNDLLIRPFSIPHDSAEPVGYSVFADKFKISIATDIGHVTENIVENIKNSDILLLESNHDEDMLKNGSYPYSLKQRILGNNGHLSNRIAGNLIANIINEKLKHVFLGHLSNENNTSYIAYETVKNILNQYNISVGSCLNLHLAPRADISNKIELH